MSEGKKEEGREIDIVGNSMKSVVEIAPTGNNRLKAYGWLIRDVDHGLMMTLMIVICAWSRCKRTGGWLFWFGYDGNMEKFIYIYRISLLWPYLNRDLWN